MSSPIAVRAQPSLADDVPLFVDLDGTLIKSDVLLESFVGRIRRDPLVVFKVVGWLLRGRAALKQALARDHEVAIDLLPYNETLCARLRDEAQRGRRIYLASAADRNLAEDVAAHLGFFTGVLASDGTRNLKGAHKLAAIRESIGEASFDYAGNGAEDLDIWPHARHALVVNATTAVEASAHKTAKVEQVISREGGRLRHFVRALRVHQWLKNLLVFVPLLTSFSFLDPQAWLLAMVAFAAFSAVASGSYMVNDLLDLNADRAHPRKRLRPFAAGHLSIALGLQMSVLLLVAGLALAVTLSWPFFIALAVYLTLTTAYSVWIKTYVLADVLTLAGLYTLRVIAGAVAIGVDVSVWLLAFSGFLFLSLALVKRCAELGMLVQSQRDAASGRDYRVSDLSVLQPIGIASGCAAVLVLALYVSAPEVAHRFGMPQLLWFMCPCLLYWLGRVWIKTGRGEMHDDPVIFSVKDRGSRVVVAIIVAFFVAAALIGKPH